MKKSKNSMSLKHLPLPLAKSARLELRSSKALLLPAKSTLNLLSSSSSSSHDKLIKESIAYVATNDSPTGQPFEVERQRICS